MFLMRNFCRFLALPMAALMFAVSMPLGAAQAALVSTEQVVEQSGIEADRMRIAALISRDDVQRELKARGVDPDEALARVAALSDAEVRKIADRIDTMPAGQDALGTVLAAAVIVFIVLLITDLLGVTDIFPFIKKSR
ncbi:MAG: PA2779 family protein [Rhodospirillales bacterium]|nr:MAG: PA2779 family protein [Rhodospirillales bacterium]